MNNAGLLMLVVPSSLNTARIFIVHALNQSRYIVHTIAGKPSAPLENPCGFSDAQPPLLAHFNTPKGMNFYLISVEG
jgi:hypothetical protein